MHAYCKCITNFFLMLDTQPLNLVNEMLWHNPSFAMTEFGWLYQNNQCGGHEKIRIVQHMQVI